MQNLLKILQRYSNFLLFIALEVVAFFLILRNHAYPRSRLLSTANSVVAWQYGLVDECTNYLNLRDINEQLSVENADLRTKLATILTFSADSLPLPIQWDNKWYLQYIPVEIVHLTFAQPHNYITIDKGKNDSIYVGMGVRNKDGVVGIVQTVGNHYSIVVPLIHTESNLSCRFAKNDYISTLQWDGLDYRFANLTDVASHFAVNIGDTIVTSGLTPAFPPNIPVGIVETATLNKGDSYYTVRVRLSANFRKLKYVQAISNKYIHEIEQLQNGLD